MKLQVFGLLLAFIAASSARSARQVQRAHFMADGSNDVAVNMLQSFVAKKQNVVFSPLGYNTILAVLTEGARGNTRNQLVAGLKLPEDTYAVRDTYKRVLTEMTDKQVINKPEFKSWFYVYKNYTVEDSYKSILKDYYLIDVNEVDRYEFAEDEQGTQAPAVVNSELPNQTDSPPAKTSVKKDSSEEDSKESGEDKVSKEDNSKEDDSKEDESKEDNSKENESKEDDSSEEKRTKTKKPSNVMKIKEKDDIAEKTQVVETDGPSSVAAVPESNPEPTEVPQDSPVDNKTEAETSSSTDLPETTPQPKEGTNASEASQLDGKLIDSETPKTTIDVRKAKRDVANDATTNQLTNLDSTRVAALKTLERMIVFNALYFRGNWSARFSTSKEKRPFHISPTEEKLVDTIHAEDEFETGFVSELDAWALDLPYQGDRYSLLILVPSGQDGLEGLSKKLEGFSFYNIDKHLTKLRASVCIPKLKFYSITHPKEALMKKGITDIFNEEADLSGITKDKGLFLEELVQLVTFEVDESESSYNYLTSSDLSDLRSSMVPFTADQPFIFFLRDKSENLNIVSGIVTDPEIPPRNY